ncbi:MAG: hypothetical protein QNI87_02930 [Erythrobacter sp.]|uniref:hypothetical protein n=1 Tax=Erythrobacter sp. TaxID=1042 RepID=UPI002621F01C|nr:hypothetical protein [Erythrobacter sp.]MDJ0977464.1 hypothetical protein [Erythrobacter sp.]
MKKPDPAGLCLLFPAGKRPTRAALRDFAQAQRAVSLTHDPADESYIHLVTPDQPANAAKGTSSVSSEVADRVWVELLREGLTFDLVGLAPGGACEFPVIEHRFDLEAVPTAFRSEALHLSPGQHLSGGETSAPVVKGLIGLARDLVHHFAHLEAAVWPHSQSAIGRRFFESVSTAWLEGGPFPALGLTAFRETMDRALQSVGLEFWIGQELRIEPPLSLDKVAATRLGVRLINHMVTIGGLEDSERIIAPDGSRLVMRPSQNGKFVRVWPE